MWWQEEIDTLYEGVWKIESVEPINENEILVSFTTGFYKSKEAAENPVSGGPYEFGPQGNSILTVTLPADAVPSPKKFNAGQKNNLYETLTERLDFEVEDV